MREKHLDIAAQGLSLHLPDRGASRRRSRLLLYHPLRVARRLRADQCSVSWPAWCAGLSLCEGPCMLLTPWPLHRDNVGQFRDAAQRGDGK